MDTYPEAPNQSTPQVPQAPAAPTGVAAASVAGGLNGAFPAELHGWNWGAFLLTWIWGIGNSVWISLIILLSFIPIVGWIAALVVWIMLGAKGNEWAWQHRKFESVEQFKAVQQAWTKWAVGIFLVSVGLGILGAWLGVLRGSNG